MLAEDSRNTGRLKPDSFELAVSVLTAIVDQAVRSVGVEHLGLEIVLRGTETTQVLASAGSNQTRRSASLIKLPVLFALVDAIRTGRLSWASSVPALGKAGGCGVLQYFKETPQICLRDAAMLMISVSDNRATNAVIEAVGIEAVNEWIVANGLKSTTLSHEMSGQSWRKNSLDNMTSVADVTSLIMKTATGSNASIMREILSTQQLNDRLGTSVPPEWRIFHKTGELEGLRHDAALFERSDGVLIAATVMMDGFNANLGLFSAFGCMRIYADIAEALTRVMHSIPSTNSLQPLRVR